MMNLIKQAKKPFDRKYLLLDDPYVNSRYAESFRTLRTNLYFSMMEKELGSLLVTSASAGEGKTNTVINLGHTIARTGKRVLMVDADLRRPGLSNAFQLKKSTGLSNLLNDLLAGRIDGGNIADYGLNDLIILIKMQKRTCLLNISDAVNETELSFFKGELVHIEWRNRPAGMALADVLVRENLISAKDMQLAVEYQLKSIRRLEDILLVMGMIAEIDLNKVLAVHMMEAFRLTVDMVTGTFQIKSVSEEEVKHFEHGRKATERLFGEYFSRGSESSFINTTLDAAIQATKTENLFLLPAGDIPPNPSELLGSTLTSYLLQRLTEKFDILIIDSSPVMPVSDPLLLASLVDGVAIVIQAGMTDRKLVNDAAQQLTRANANLLGAVLNKVKPKTGGYYKYQYKYAQGTPR